MSKSIYYSDSDTGRNEYGDLRGEYVFGWRTERTAISIFVYTQCLYSVQTDSPINAQFRHPSTEIWLHFDSRSRAQPHLNLLEALLLRPLC
jgi:hypothetical protein